MKTIFPKEKPYIDKNGVLQVPKHILFGGQVEPSLTTTEWMTLIYMSINKELCSDKETLLCYKKMLTGSNTTFWRTKKKLKEKGYI